MKKTIIIIGILLIIGYFLKDKNISINLGDTYYILTYFTLAIYIIYILVLIEIVKFIKRRFKK